MRPAALLIAAVTALAVVLVAAWAKRRGVGWPGLAAGAAVCFAGAVVCLSGGCGGGGAGAGVALGGKEAPPEGLERFHGELLTPDEIAAILKVGTARLPAAALPTTADQLPRLPYRPAPYRARTSLHLGQRKLLLSEVDFLTARARPGDTVVYAGAAPGIHTGFLAALFPAARFELYDPRPFALRGSAEQLGRIRAHQKYFTDDDAAAYAGRDDVLFVCDIRTATPGAADTEERVAADMAAQARWVDIMQPRAAMLKYRPPYSSDAPFEYLAGEVRLQAWGPRSSSEGRLVAERPYQTVPQEAREYEDRMFYLSSVVREWAAYDHGIPVRLVPGLDHCFDCALEARIWERYLLAGAAQSAARAGGKPPQRAKEAASPSQVAACFNRATRALGRGLDHPPHGLKPGALMLDKRESLPWPDWARRQPAGRGAKGATLGDDPELRDVAALGGAPPGDGPDESDGPDEP